METLAGRFVDLDRDGNLLLALPDGTLRRIAAGDIFLPGMMAPSPVDGKVDLRG